MNSSLNEKVEILKESLAADSRVVRLNSLEEKLNTNEEVMVLSYKKDAALVEFEDALKHFKEDSDEVKLAQKKLYEAKKALDLYPLVQEYNKAYKEVRILCNKINNELFLDFAKKYRGGFDD